MSVEAVRTVVGEDGIQIAVEALKEMAQNGGFEPVRLQAAQTLLQYGLASHDAFGNSQLG